MQKKMVPQFNLYWNLKDLLVYSYSVNKEINGVWVPARPLNHKFFTFFDRLKLAWMVFMGKLECFQWPEGQ